MIPKAIKAGTLGPLNWDGPESYRGYIYKTHAPIARIYHTVRAIEGFRDIIREFKLVAPNLSEILYPIYGTTAFYTV